MGGARWFVQGHWFVAAAYDRDGVYTRDSSGCDTRYLTWSRLYGEVGFSGWVVGVSISRRLDGTSAGDSLCGHSASLRATLGPEVQRMPSDQSTRQPAWYLDELAHAGPEHLDAAYVEGYDREARVNPTTELSHVQDLGLNQASTLLDLGAGTGTMALGMRAAIEDVNRMRPWARAIISGNARFARSPGRLQAVQGVRAVICRSPRQRRQGHRRVDHCAHASHPPSADEFASAPRPSGAAQWLQPLTRPRTERRPGNWPVSCSSSESHRHIRSRDANAAAHAARHDNSD
jgi:hypothetical protein